MYVCMLRLTSFLTFQIFKVKYNTELQCQTRVIFALNFLLYYIYADFTLFLNMHA